MKSGVLRIKDGGNWWKRSLWYIWCHNTGVLVGEGSNDVWSATDYHTGNYLNVLLKTGSCWYVNLTDVSVELHDNVNGF